MHSAILLIKTIEQKSSPVLFFHEDMAQIAHFLICLATICD